MNKQFDIKLTTRFKKQLKVLRQQPNFNYDELDKVINMLSNNELLPEKYQNHLLNPKSKGIWECHIQNDVLLEYKKNETELILLLLGIGSHSNLFK